MLKKPKIKKPKPKRVFTGTEKIVLGMDVVEAARQRLVQIYTEFDLPIICFSGGKDDHTVNWLGISASAAKRRTAL